MNEYFDSLERAGSDLPGPDDRHTELQILSELPLHDTDR